MSNYSTQLPEDLVNKLVKYGVPIFANFCNTYGYIFDWFSTHKSIEITLEPFFTFSLNDHIGYTWKLSYVDLENGELKTVTENDVWTSDKGYGGSFELTARDAIKYAMQL